jgi:cobalt-zinc-cadmium efflux system membrane fusion protein
MKKLLVALAACGIVTAGWYGMQSTSEATAAPAAHATPPREPNVLRYAPDAPQLAYLKIAPAEAGPVPAIEPLQGHVTYDEDHTSRISTPIAGRVLKIHAEPGDRVKAGQALVTIDSPDFAQASADARKAESDLMLKKAAFERAHTLFEGNVLPRKDFESAEADMQQSEIELDRARARLRNLGPVNANGYALTSRIGGIVTERQVNPGSEVRPDAPGPLFVVSDPTHLWINVEVPEKDLGKVHEGQHFKVEADGYPGESFDAVARMIGKVLDPTSRRVIVRCSVENPDEKLKPEMYVHATPLGRTDTEPHVPNEALITEGLQSFVFVERSPGVLEKRRVTLNYRGHEESYIAAGLNTGEHIVVRGALLLNAEMTGG